jgi:hypothetical protein
MSHQSAPALSSQVNATQPQRFQQTFRSRRLVGTLALVVGLVVAPFALAADPILGSWVGTANVENEATPFELEIHACGPLLCATFNLPDLDIEHMPLNAVHIEAATGQLDAKPISATLANKTLTGTLAAFGGGIFVAAIPYGQQATFTLHRGELSAVRAATENIAFMDGDVKLAGTLVKPYGKGPFPAIVFVHGSGPSTRWYAFGEALTLTKFGFASVVYDKRGAGESGGDWTKASLDDLSQDAIAAIDYAATRPDIDARRIGLWGHSQGGWVVPRALSLGARASFAVVLAGGGVRPRQVEMSDYGHTLDHLGVSGDQRTRALALVDNYLEYLGGRRSHAQILAALDADRGESWYPALGLDHILPDEKDRSAWSWVPDYDPAGDIAKLHVPLLLIFAGNDDEIPTPTAMAQWNAALSDDEAARTQVAYFPKAAHHIRTGAMGWQRHPPQYEELLQGWLGRQ